MNKKLTLIALTSITLAGNISAATWKMKNNLGRDICVTINTGVSQIRRHISNGQEVPFRSKACLYSISVKEGAGHAGMAKGRCPKGLTNIAKITAKEIKGILKNNARLCKNMNFEVIKFNGQPKIVIQGTQSAQPTTSTAMPAPPVFDLGTKKTPQTQPLPINTSPINVAEAKQEIQQYYAKYNKLRDSFYKNIAKPAMANQPELLEEKLKKSILKESHSLLEKAKELSLRVNLHKDRFILQKVTIPPAKGGLPLKRVINVFPSNLKKFIQDVEKVNTL